MAAANTPTLKDVVSDDLNYERWAAIVKTTLVEKELWDVVENGVPPDPSKIHELAATVQVEDLSNWRDCVGKDMNALQILQCALPDSVFRKTLDTASAKDLWDLLKESNEQAELEKKFEQLRMEEGERVSSYVDRVVESDPRLADAKSACLGITKLLISLSDSYFGTTPVIMEELRVVQNPTFNAFREVLDMFESGPVEVGSSSDDEVFIKLLIPLSDSYFGAAPVMEELMGPQNLTFNGFRVLLDRFESAPVETINGILEVGSSSQSKEDCSSITREGDSMRSRRKRGECFQCGGRGHFSRDCRNKNLRNQSVSAPLKYHTSGIIKNQRQIEIDNQSRNEVAEYRMLAFNLAGMTFDEDMWMIYTTTSNHMTPYEKYFTTLDRTHRGRIKLVTGDTIMSQGMGDVMIMTDKGKKTIKNVLFVPVIDRNVLSVGQMNEVGYGIVMTAHKCTIKDQSGRLFGEAMWEERGFSLRLQVVEPNVTS